MVGLFRRSSVFAQRGRASFLWHCFLCTSSTMTVPDPNHWKSTVFRHRRRRPSICRVSKVPRLNASSSARRPLWAFRSFRAFNASANLIFKSLSSLLLPRRKLFPLELFRQCTHRSCWAYHRAGHDTLPANVSVQQHPDACRLCLR